MSEETVQQFNERLRKKLPYKEHSIRCQLRIDNNSWDHWDCECKCHNSQEKDKE
jgi:hypothetical protein